MPSVTRKSDFTFRQELQRTISIQQVGLRFVEAEEADELKSLKVDFSGHLSYALVSGFLIRFSPGL